MLIKDPKTDVVSTIFMFNSRSVKKYSPSESGGDHHFQCMSTLTLGEGVIIAIMCIRLTITCVIQIEFH
jgi:hypothetical protein